MKRILLIIALAILPMVCHAQLNVKQQIEKMEKIASSRAGFMKLMRQGDLFYMTIPTSNEFDDTFIFYLGEGKESAMETLDDLIKLCGTIEKGSPIVIDNRTKSCYISKGMMGGLDLNQDGYAGHAELSKMECQKFLKAIKDLK